MLYVTICNITNIKTLHYGIALSVMYCIKLIILRQENLLLINLMEVRYDSKYECIAKMA